MSGGRGVQSQTMKQGGDFQYPALTAGPCLCPGRHAGAKQPGCRYAGALATPRLCVRKLPTRVRMRDAGLILEIGREPFHLRDPCEQPSHVGSGLGAKPSDEHAAEHITELPSQSRDMHPNAVPPETEKCEALRVVFPPLSPLLRHEDAGVAGGVACSGSVSSPALPCALNRTNRL